MIKSSEFVFRDDSCSKCPLFVAESPMNSPRGDYENVVDYIFIAERNVVGTDISTNRGIKIVIDNLNRIGMKNYFIMSNSLCHCEDMSHTESAAENCRLNTDIIIRSIMSVNAMYGHTPPKIIIFGKDAGKRFFTSTDIIGKKVTLKSLRGNKFQNDNYAGVDFYFTVNPASFQYDQENEKMFVADMESIIHSDSIELAAAENSYFLIDSVEFFNDVMGILSNSEKIAFDIESSGLNYLPFIKIKERKVKGQKIEEESFHKDILIGISFTNARKAGVYLPIYVRGSVMKNYHKKFQHPLYSQQEINSMDDEKFYFYLKQENEDYVLGEVKKLLENENIKKIAHNGKFDTTFLEGSLGIKVKNFWMDTLIAQHVLDENSPKKLQYLTDIRYPDLRGYKDVVYNELSNEQEETETYDKVPLDKIWVYGAKDADATFRLHEDLLKDIDEKTEKAKKQPYGGFDGRRLLFDFYMPLNHAYAKCELKGILYDSSYAIGVATDYANELEEIQGQVDVIAAQVSETPYETKREGMFLNMASSDQLGRFFFTDLQWPRFKEKAKAKELKKYRKNDRTAGYVIEEEDGSTDKDSLKRILEYFDGLGDKYKEESELLSLILRWKAKSKMISTYLRGKKIRSRLDMNDYLHFVMKITGTTSGRLSSTPNIQNLPRDPKIRGIIIPPSGFKLFSCDLSQAELRIMGEYANDEVCRMDFRNGVDLHWEACLDLFYHSQRLEYDSKNKEMKRLRKLTKLCNFGQLYGAAPATKMTQVNEKLERGEEKITLQISEAHAEWFRSRYYGIDNYLSKMKEHILKHGYIDSVFGRRRNLPDAFNTNEWIRAEAVRSGINAQIQGTASDITQLAFIKMQNWLEQHPELKTYITHTVHDEIDGCLWSEEEDLIKETLIGFMTELGEGNRLQMFKMPLESEFDVYKERWGT